MATNLKTVALPPASMTPLRVLTGLYRSTFVDNMQERFRSMLTGAYDVYVTALGEDFDPPLRAHLTDILQEIISRESEFTEIFEEELLRHFRLLIEQSGIPDASAPQIDEQGQSRRLDALPKADEDPGVQEFVAKTIRSIETRHGSIILAVTRTYVKLVGQPAEDFRPPWSPAYLFSAFAAVLNRIEVPIHGRVKLALYQTFAQEVLRHIGDACLAFRDVLPSDLSQLNIPAGSETSSTATATPPNGSRSSDSNPNSTHPSLPKSSQALADKENSFETISCVPDNPQNKDGNSTADIPRTYATAKLLRLTIALLGGFGLIWGGWWLGTYIARTQSMPVLDWNKPAETQGTVIENPSAETRPEQPAAKQPPPEQAPIAQAVPESPPTAQASAEPPTSAPRAPEPTPQVDPGEKREIMRAVKLKNFNWKVDANGNGMLFKLTIANASKHWISGIEIVCSQYSGRMDFLEAAKTVLGEPIKPGQAKDFQAIPIGFANKRTERVNCVIADLVVDPNQ